MPQHSGPSTPAGIAGSDAQRTAHRAQQRAYVYVLLQGSFGGTVGDEKVRGLVLNRVDVVSGHGGGGEEGARWRRRLQGASTEERKRVSTPTRASSGTMEGGSGHVSKPVRRMRSARGGTLDVPAEPSMSRFCFAQESQGPIWQNGLDAPGRAWAGPEEGKGKHSNERRLSDRPPQPTTRAGVLSASDPRPCDTSWQSVCIVYACTQNPSGSPSSPSACMSR